MAVKLLPNRISKLPAPDALVKIREAVRIFLDALGPTTDITDEEYAALRKIADKSKRVTDDVFAIVEDKPEFLEEPLALEEIHKDKAYYEFCDAARVLLTPVMTELEREQNIAGSEYANACNVYEDSIKRKVNLGNPKARSVQAQLNGVERNRGGSPSKPAAKPVDPGK